MGDCHLPKHQNIFSMSLSDRSDDGHRNAITLVHPHPIGRRRAADGQTTGGQNLDRYGHRGSSQKSRAPRPKFAYIAICRPRHKLSLYASNEEIKKVNPHPICNLSSVNLTLGTLGAVASISEKLHFKVDCIPMRVNTR